MSASADRGAVTVEAAIVLCAVISVLVLGIIGLGSMSTYLRCTDAAKEIARLVSRNDREKTNQVMDYLAPQGAKVDIQLNGDAIVVEVSTGSPMSFIGGGRIRATAYAVTEPDSSSPDEPQTDLETKEGA